MSLHEHQLRRDLERLAGRVALAWSCGKDSTAILTVAAETWSSGIVVFGSHGADDYPGTCDLVEVWRQRAQHLEFIVLDWSSELQDLRDGDGRRIQDLVDAREQRDRATMASCLAEHDLRESILGLRAAESARRRRAAKGMRAGRGYRPAASWGTDRTHVPILDWTDEHVWQTIDEHQAPYHPIYDLLGRSPTRSHPQLFMPHGALNQRAPGQHRMYPNTFGQPSCDYEHPLLAEWWEERCARTPGLPFRPDDVGARA